MRKFLLLLLACLTLACATDISAAKPQRTSKSIKKERRLTAGEVERTRKQIKQNAGETRRQLNRLQSLAAEAGRCEKSIAGLNSRIAELDRRIKAIDDSIAVMEHNLSVLRTSYADNLRDMRSRRQLMSELAMIFSSRTFTEAYRRHRYLLEFEHWQKDKTVRIHRLSAEIAQRRNTAAEARQRQAEALEALSKEKRRLDANREETEKVVDGLKRQGSSLKKVLDEKQRQLKRLDEELDRIIAEEARKAEEARRAEEARLAAEAKRKAEEARRAEEAKRQEAERAGKPNSGDKTDKKAADKAPQPAKETPKKASEQSPAKSENIALSGSFEANKGKLPAPVTGSYAVVSHFGLNSHPDVASIKINNSGIDIEASQGAVARAVFDGTVSSVFRVSGYQNVVMLRHGNYLTVYAGIDDLSVKKGDKVKAGQALGTVHADPDDNDRRILHFEVRRERAKLNPEDWIR